jgi:hypothetical protein
VSLRPSGRYISADNIRDALTKHDGNRQCAAYTLRLNLQLYRKWVCFHEALGHKFPRFKPVAVGKEYTPTPEEIAVACAEVRATWSDAERKRRCQFAEFGFPMYAGPCLTELTPVAG